MCAQRHTHTVTAVGFFASLTALCLCCGYTLQFVNAHRTVLLRSLRLPPVRSLALAFSWKPIWWRAWASQTHNGLFVSHTRSHTCVRYVHLHALVFLPLVLLTSKLRHSTVTQSTYLLLSPPWYSAKAIKVCHAVRHLWLSVAVQSKSAAEGLTSNGRWLKCSWSMYSWGVFIASIDYRGAEALTFPPSGSLCFCLSCFVQCLMIHGLSLCVPPDSSFLTRLQLTKLIKLCPLHIHRQSITTLNNQRTLLPSWTSSSHHLFFFLRGSSSLWPLTASHPSPPPSAAVSHSFSALLPCLISVSGD